MRSFFKIILNKSSIEEIKNSTSSSCVSIVKEYIKQLNSNIKIDKGRVEVTDEFGSDKVIGFRWRVSLLDKKSHLKLGWKPSTDNIFYIAEIKSAKSIKQDTLKEYVENIQYNLEINGFYCKSASYDEWNTDDNFWLGHGWTLEFVNSFDSLMMSKLLGNNLV